VYSDTPRYVLFKGGEGGGKSVAGIVKALDRLARGMSGAMVSPDLEHFKKSLWPEFTRWCPWHRVIERQRYRALPGWEPSHTFEMVFHNDLGGYSTLLCGGAKESEIGTWEGPNLNFVHLDEIRRHKSAIALKTLDGRVRIPGPNGEPPGMWITTTPRKHWLFDYFGPLLPDDPLAEFKRDSLVVTLLTSDNAANLEAGFVEKRAQSLTEAEARVLLRAEWEDIDEGQRFLPQMLWWDACQEALPVLGGREPLVVAMDAATGAADQASDCFGIVGVTRHPSRPDDVAVRFAHAWQAKAGAVIDFEGTEDDPGPLRFVRWLGEHYNVLCLTYDPTELRYAASQLEQEGLFWLKEFNQGEQRLEADRQLLDLVMQRRIAHDGNPDLWAHLDHADRKLDTDGRRLRIVKRHAALKVDLAVALSMACFECLRLNL
jgi:hypothetical protein